MKKIDFPVCPTLSPRRPLRIAFLFVFVLSLVAASALLSGVTVEASKGARKRRQPTQRRAKTERARPGTRATLAAKSHKATSAKIDEPSIGEQGDGDEREVIDARRQWFMMQRAYPFDAPPAEGRLRAWRARPKDAGRGKDGYSDTRSVAQTWRSIGPSPTTPAFPDNWGLTSGRLNSIAVHPTAPHIILIGAATGGIWRSTDGGANFVPVSDTHVDLAVGSVAFSPSNPSIAYAGMGDLDNGYFGTGILKSTDAGATWARISNNTLPPLGTTAEIEVDPTNHNRVYVLQATRTLATSYNDFNSDGALYRNGFYLSEDGGINWRRTLAGRPRDIAIHPTNPQILYLGATLVDPLGVVPAGPAGIYKSLDGGATWLPAPIFTATTGTTTTDVRIAVTPAAPERLYVISGMRTAVRIDISDNGGVTWTNKSTTGIDPGQFGYNAYLHVDPSDANKIYVGTRDVFKSVNGGGTWDNLSRNFSGTNFSYSPFSSKTHPDQHAFAFAPNDPNTIYVGNDGGISRSTDGGATFQSLNASLTLTQFVGISMHPTNPAITYGGTQDNGTQRRVSGTNGWREFSEGDGGRSIVNAANPSMVFTTYVYGKVSRYTDNGTSSRTVIAENATFGEPATGQRIAFYPPMVGNGIDATIYFGTYRLFTCTNCASAPNWVAPGGTRDLTKQENVDCSVSPLPVECGDVLSAIGVQRAPHSPSQVIYTGSSKGRVMVSTDGGANWTDKTGGLPNRFVESITVNSSNAAEAFITYGGFGTGHVFRTTNHGDSWTNIGGTPGQPNIIPNIPVSAFLIDPVTPTTFYAGTDIGVFRSTDNGATWATFNQGMLPAVVTGFATSAGGVIQLSTYGRGAFELTGTAPACAYSVTSTSAQSFPASGGVGSFQITTGAGCAWSALSLAPSWLTITNGSGTGNGVVNFNVAPNSGAARSGQILHTLDSFYTVSQAASASPALVAFGMANYAAGEGDGRAIVTVTRSGNTSAALSVDVATVDDPAAVPCNPQAKMADGTPYPQGKAYARCDYATSIETVTFAAGDTQPKSVAIPLIDDAQVEGPETVQLELRSPANALLAAQKTATLTINDNGDTAGAPNPINQTPLFVRMQYLDFLSREPEAGEPWSGVLTRCANPFNLDPNNPAALCDRLIVSKSFFESAEFRLKGLFAFTFYRVAFNRLPEYVEIIPDMRSVTGQSAQEVYAKRALFPVTVTQRPEFRAAYDALSNTAFIDALLVRYGAPSIRTPDPANPESGDKVTLSRAELVNRLNTLSLTRAQALRAIVESDEVKAAEYNRAYVAMQYYGYLRRTPEAEGYQAWLKVINQDPTNVRVMIDGFMNSNEYRARFGQ